MMPGSQFPHTNARQSAIAGNDAAQLMRAREIAQRAYEQMLPATETERDEAFLAIFGIERNTKTLDEQDEMWRQWLLEEMEAGES